jgi:hypothetical protein
MFIIYPYTLKDRIYTNNIFIKNQLNHFFITCYGIVLYYSLNFKSKKQLNKSLIDKKIIIHSIA